MSDARLAARAIAGSVLVKAAIHGGDPNWGRILAALGRSGARVEPDFCRVSAGGLTVFDKGAPHPVSDHDIRGVFAQKRIDITVALEEGAAEAHAWGCDLSAEYVRINADYTT